MKTKKAFAAIIAAFVLIFIVSGTIYFNKTYAKLDGKFYKTDIKEISPNLRFTKIKEINKCTEIEELLLSSAYENAVSGFTDFKELSKLSLSFSKVNSSDSRKISTFGNLNELYIYSTDIDLEGFDNSNLFYLCMLQSEAKHFDSLANCLSLKSISITDSVIDDSIINSDGKYVMKDSGFLSSFDNITELGIYVDSIEDVSGICEMDSLQKLSVNSSSFSDKEKGFLEDNGIIVILK